MNELIRHLKYNLRYLGNPPWDTGIPVPELVDFIARHPAGKALDLGCGTGTNMSAFLEAGWKVDGVDVAYLAVNQARKKLKKFGDAGRVFLKDVTRLKILENQYDLIYDIGCFHTLRPSAREQYVANIKRLLSCGGSYLTYGRWRSTQAGNGIRDEDIDRFSQFMHLEKRLDSRNRRERASIFLEFVRKC